MGHGCPKEICQHTFLISKLKQQLEKFKIALIDATIQIKMHWQIIFLKRCDLKPTNHLSFLPLNASNMLKNIKSL